MTRVLHLHYGKEGGAERFFVSLAEGLAERGVEQRFSVRPNVSWRGRVAALGPVIEGHARRRSPRTWLLRRRLDRLVREWRPDAVVAWMDRAARMLPPDGTAALRVTRLGDFPRSLAAFARTDLVLANVPAIERHCRAMGWGGAVRVVSNFPRPVASRPVDRAALDTPADAFLVATGGRLVRRKGIDVAVRAVAALPDAWLWVLGDGAERTALERLAREHGVAARTRFAGWLPEPAHHVAAADAFVLPSRHEPLGNMLLEAWAAGVPTVATRSEGPGWYMVDGRDGVLVAVDDVEGVARGLRLIRDDRAAAARFVAGARATLAATFGREAVLDRYEALFRKGRGALRDP